MRDLENSTTRLGELLRSFQSDVCPAYQTFDLPAEEAARVRRKAAATKKTEETIDQPKGKQKAMESGSKKLRTFNLNTYKIHALGSYAEAIRLYGSPDNYNSQTVCNSFYSESSKTQITLYHLDSHLLQGELEHRRGKRFFQSVRKGKHAILGIGLQVRRQRLMHRLKERQKSQEKHLAQAAGSSQHATDTGTSLASADDLPTVPFEETETLPPTLPSQHYHISADKRQKVQVSQWLHRNQADPAVKVCCLSYSGCSVGEIEPSLGFLTTSQESPLISIAWL